MAGINFLGIKSGSSQSKTHRYLAVKKQSVQIPCREFARKFKTLKSLELPQRFVLSNPLCVFCFAWILRQRLIMTRLICHFELSLESEKSTQIKRKLTILGYFAALSMTIQRVFGMTRQVSMTKSYAILFNPNFNFLVFERKNS